MKKFSFGASILALLLCACQTKQQYTITANMEVFEENGIEIDSIVLMNNEGNTLQSATDIKKELKMTGTTDKAEMANLVLYIKYAGEPTTTNVTLVLEPGDIVMDTESGVFKGTPLNDAVFDFQAKLIKSFEEDGDLTALISDFVKEHKDDASCPLVLCADIAELVDANVLTELWESCSEQNKQTEAMQELKAKLDKKSLTAAGKKFTDFEAEYDGKVQRLSDYVGKGKYVLVDFWASWCGPCRQEVPNIIAVYDKYKGDRFEVLGVATWDEPEATLKAIEEEGIKYPQILNAQRAGSDAYGIEGIPEIILFAPDGTILMRGLRGDDIEKAVSKALAGE